MIRGSGLSKVFGDRWQDALDMARRGDSRQEVLRATGCTVAVNDVSFDVERGELFVVMGLSGSGKSTLVRLINRLISPSAGTIEIEGRDISDMPEAELRAVRNRTLGMVFQHFALFPHRTVRENAAYGLRVRGESEARSLDRAEWALHEVGHVVVGRRREDLGAGSQLHPRAVLHQQDAVADAHRLVEVVRDEDDGLAQLRLELEEQVLHVAADQGIERGERLVHQEDVGVGCQRARQAHALLHAAGELGRIVVAKVG